LVQCSIANHNFHIKAFQQSDIRRPSPVSESALILGTLIYIYYVLIHIMHTQLLPGYIYARMKAGQNDNLKSLFNSCSTNNLSNFVAFLLAATYVSTIYIKNNLYILIKKKYFYHSVRSKCVEISYYPENLPSPAVVRHHSPMTNKREKNYFLY
jgi:hypothetical protein